MTQTRSVPRNSLARPLTAVLTLGPLLALVATLAVAPDAGAAPKRCTYKPAACKLEESRAKVRAEAQASKSVESGPAPGTASLLCSSKSAACARQTAAAEKQAAATAAAPTGAGPAIRPASCSLKPAACWLEEKRDAR